MNDGREEPTVWVIRMTRRANSDRAAAWFHFAETANEEIAQNWRQGLDAEIAKLAELPTRWPVAEEDKLFREKVRRMLYRRTPGGPASYFVCAAREH